MPLGSSAGSSTSTTPATAGDATARRAAFSVHPPTQTSAWTPSRLVTAPATIAPPPSPSRRQASPFRPAEETGHQPLLQEDRRRDHRHHRDDGDGADVPPGGAQLS